MRWGEADILVKDGDGFIIYEIKTSDTCRECVKEALGQLMVYGFWPNSPKINGLVIVGKPELDTQTALFIDIVTKNWVFLLCIKNSPYSRTLIFMGLYQVLKICHAFCTRTFTPSISSKPLPNSV